MSTGSSNCLIGREELDKDINKVVFANVKCLEEILNKLYMKIDRGELSREAVEELADGVIRRAESALSLMSTWGSLYTILFMGTHAVKTKSGALDAALQLGSLNNKVIFEENIGKIRDAIVEEGRKRLEKGNITSLSYALYLGFIIKSLYLLGFLNVDELSSRTSGGKLGSYMLKLLIEKLVRGEISGRIVLRIADIGRRMIDIYLTSLKYKLSGEGSTGSP